ncbi:MAG: DUF1846 domain-containing protein [Chitinispirillaceae bacterium]|nr:DUF1846 domain-containing protein [Chitinispirillaceae bacterium]
MAQQGFDNERYLAEQTAMILERVRRFNNKLYLEFGGKILFDLHAARILPGFDANVKMRLLQELQKRSPVDVILTIFAGDIERKKMRADFGITYDADAQKQIDDFAEWGVTIGSVVITRYEDQPAANLFRNKLERRGVRVYTHRKTKGYPTDVECIVSDDGYGANPRIETSAPLCVVTGPGPNSGKLATCLSQLYHDYRQGIHSGYAKFETFPIWNLPLKHPVNVAYEAATADIRDFNCIDHFHLEAYGVQTVNYNRDVEVFPVLKRILHKITGSDGLYRSPTDMGVNCAGFGIVNDNAVRQASIQEIIRRYYRYACEYAMGLVDKETVERVSLLLEDLGIKHTDRQVVTHACNAASEAPSRGKGNEGIFCGAAIELPGGEIVTGKNSELMHAASALVLNTVKQLAGIPDRIPLLPPAITESLQHLKKNILMGRKTSLDLEETLIALSISATSNPAAAEAMEKLKLLRGCEVHLTHMPTPGDEAGLRKLGVNLTSEPEFASKSLFIS